MAGASGVLSSHVTATLQSLGPGGSASPHFADMVPSAPVLPAPVAYQMPQQATVNQILQQAAASALNTSGAATTTTAGRGRLAGAHPAVPSTSLAALVPHVPQVAPPPPPHAAAALTAAAAAAANSEASAPSAGNTSHTKALPCMVGLGLYSTNATADQSQKDYSIQ